jgi:hypothetical protein
MKQCPKCYGFHSVGAACEKRSSLAKEIIQGLKEAKQMAAALPAYNPSCPVCQARRKKQIESQRKYRQKKGTQ